MSADIAVNPPCVCATTADIVLSGLQTLDGITVLERSRVLVRAQSDARHNGIYLSSAGDWIRAFDFNDGEITTGTIVWVYSGSTMQGWHEITTPDVVVDSTSIDWRLSSMTPWPEVTCLAASGGTSIASAVSAQITSVGAEAAGYGVSSVEATYGMIIESHGGSSSDSVGATLFIADAASAALSGSSAAGALG